MSEQIQSAIHQDSDYGRFMEQINALTAPLVSLLHGTR